MLNLDEEKFSCPAKCLELSKPPLPTNTGLGRGALEYHLQYENLAD